MCLNIRPSDIASSFHCSVMALTHELFLGQINSFESANRKSANQLIKEMAEQGMEGRVIGWVLDTTGVPPWRLYTQTDGQEVVVVWVMCYKH